MNTQDTPEAVALSEPVVTPTSTFRTVMRPKGNWLCKCGQGNFPHERACGMCARKREQFTDE